jgi:hypothetical protein
MHEHEYVQKLLHEHVANAPCKSWLQSPRALSAGPAGGLRVLAQDRSGLLTLEQRIDTIQRTYQANLSYRYRYEKDCGSLTTR